jgi:ElaB/YqjD/DUF883 family membrane-anchored ribosome-binding protein
MNQNQNQQRTSNPSSSVGNGSSGTMAKDAVNQFEDIGNKLQESGRELMNKIQDVAGPAGEKIRTGTDEAVKWVKANPIKSICIGFAASLFLGRVLFGGSRTEKKYLN